MYSIVELKYKQRYDVSQDIIIAIQDIWFI